MKKYCWVFCFLLVQCGQDGNGDLFARVKVLFNNDTVFTSDPYTPTYYGLKMLGMDLIRSEADLDPETLWINQNCQDELDDCDIQDSQRVVLDYFDLARPDGELNTDLNSKTVSIDEKEYHYMQIRLCNNHPQAEHIRWASNSLAVDKESSFSGCKLLSKKISPALVVTKGDSITLAVNYDLNGVIKTSQTQSTLDCTQSGSQTYCVEKLEYNVAAQ